MTEQADVMKMKSDELLRAKLPAAVKVAEIHRRARKKRIDMTGCADPAPYAQRMYMRVKSREAKALALKRKNEADHSKVQLQPLAPFFCRPQQLYNYVYA